MIGTIRWNLIVGGISFLVTFIISMTSNIWLTTLLRSCYSFIFLFMLVFLFRWILGTLAGLNKLNAAETEQHDPAEEHKGAALDVTTPDEEADLHQMLKDSLGSGDSGGASGFAPLKPPKLSSNQNMDAGEMAQAVRRMTEE